MPGAKQHIAHAHSVITNFPLMRLSFSGPVPTLCTSQVSLHPSVPPMGVLVLKCGVVRRIVGAFLSWGRRQWLCHWLTKIWSQVTVAVFVLLFKGCMIQIVRCPYIGGFTMRVHSACTHRCTDWGLERLRTSFCTQVSFLLLQVHCRYCYSYLPHWWCIASLICF